MDELFNLSSSDKRGLLYRDLLTCMRVAAFFMMVIGINNILIARQNEKDVEEIQQIVFYNRRFWQYL